MNDITIKNIENLMEDYDIEILPDGTVITKEIPKQDPIKILTKGIEDKGSY